MGLLAVPSDSQLGCNCSTPLKIGLCVAEILERVEGWHPRCLIQLEQSFAESKQILCQKLLSFTATKIPSHSQNCRKHRFCEQSRRHRVLFRCVLMTPRLPAIRQCLLPPPRQEAENMNSLSTALEECVYKEHFETIKESLHTADLPRTVFLLLETFSMRAGGNVGWLQQRGCPVGAYSLFSCPGKIQWDVLPPAAHRAAFGARLAFFGMSFHLWECGSRL